jgi:hypothetical protein
MKNELEYTEFDARLLEKRHKELISALSVIAESLSEDNDKDLLDAILAQGEKLKEVVGLISKIPAPKVNVDFDLTELKTSFESIKNEIIESNNKVVNSIENRLLPYSFDLNRQANGLTTSVKVNYKTAKEIN